MKPKIILASASPRRAEILRDAGIAFEIRAANVEETPLPSEHAENMVLRLAESKARAVAESLDPNIRAIVIGADTAVELDGNIFGKPRNAEDAREMLVSLSGRTHKVLTGVCALCLPDKITKSS